MFEKFRIVDLTHELTPEIPTWGGSCGFCLEVKKDYDKIFRVQQIKMHAGVGTHMDAPSHRFENGKCIHEIALEHCLCPAHIIDVSKKATKDYQISKQDILDYGEILDSSLVIGYTGWDRYWTDPEMYRKEFPTFSEEAADFLVQKNIAGLAIDTISPDGRNSDFPVHRLILGSGKYIIENIANCSHLPKRGSYVVVLPIKAKNATEAPARVIALIPRSF